jgi:citrate lyase subunit beta/citryl-CoA lyase
MVSDSNQLSDIVAGLATLLFVPADRPERYAKAASSGADAIIIDLEDAVAPENKDMARASIASALPDGCPVLIRINGAGTAWHQEDVSAVAGLAIAGVILPKTEQPEAVSSLARDLAGPVVVPLVETAAGMEAARRIARAQGAARLAFGSIDYAADLGCAHEREALLAGRSELVLASRLGGLPPPIDGITEAIDEAALIEDDARHAARLGFGGKLCIHPRQIGPAARGLRPSDADIDWARAVLASGSGAAEKVDGRMVDAPVRARARTILARAGVGS